MDEPDWDGTFLERALRAVRLLRLAFSLLWQLSPALLLALCTTLLLDTLTQPVQLYAVQRAVDAAVQANRLYLWLGVLVGCLALGQAVGPWSTTVQSRLGDRFSGVVQQRLMCAMNAWPGTTRFDDREFADTLQHFQQRASWLGPQLVLGIFSVLLDLLSMGATAALLVSVRPLLALFVLLLNLPVVASTWSYNTVTGASLAEIAPEGRRLWYLSSIAVAPNEAKDLRLRSAFDHLALRHEAVHADAERWMRQRERPVVRRMVIAQGLAVLATAAGLAWVVVLARHGQVSIGQVAMTLGALMTLRTQVSSFGVSLGRIPLALQLLPFVDRILRMPPDLPLPDAGRTRVVDGPVPVEFRDVVFTYPGESAPVLRGVSFAIEAGTSVALVGHNGCGKTTLVKLLMRFHDVDSGQVVVDGTDVRAWDVAALRRTVGALFQDFARWEASAGENIGMGDVANIDDRTRVEAAADAGNAMSVIAALPHGFEEQVGAELGGRNLSGGQWQRLALARATMSRAGLLVLDEPTAELDPRAESEVFDRFARLVAHRTVVLVSHRFSTVRMADRIVLLDHGVVREQGTHDQLMRDGREYARMYRLQASQYLDADDSGTVGDIADRDQDGRA